MSQIEIKCGIGFWKPAGWDVELLSEMTDDTVARSGEGWIILKKLLLAGFCLLLCSTVAADDVFKVTGRYAVKTVAVDDEFYIAVFKSSACPPCREFDRSGELDRLLKRFKRSVVINIDDQPQYAQGVPAVWLIRTSTREVVKRWSGATELETVEREVVRIRESKRGKVKVESVSRSCDCSSACTCGCQSGEPCECGKAKAVSPASRTQTEIDAEKHLREVHGIDASGLSLAEMEVIHDAAHGGTGYHFPGRSSMPVNRVTSNCPGGVCPTQSRMLFWRR